MITYKHTPHIILLIIFLSAILLGSMALEEPAYADRQVIESTGSPVFDEYRNDHVMGLLGNKFIVIEQELGEPAEQGYSIWLGPHYYILYQFEEGYIRFCSPEGVDDKKAVSIVMGPGQEIYGVKVGMLFSEIMAVLGTPDRGPELGINELYYMDYYLGDYENQVPEIIISFSAADIDGSTLDLFIKWETYDYNQKGLLEGERWKYMINTKVQNKVTI